ncbi:MAG: hypothetical protein LC745_07780 [Planctomycetia bacterium]|nr:hypothetical protein [Planctomycetia bacterium]
MGHYRKIDARLWGDAKFCALSPQKPSAQSLWLYLISGPHNTSLPGLFVAGEASLAEVLGWTLRDFRRCWAEIADAGMARADWKARVVWLPNGPRYNAPANPNVVSSWRALLDAIPECPLKAEACIAIGSAIPLTPSFRDAWTRAHGRAGTVSSTLAETVTVGETVSETVDQTVRQISNSSSNSSSKDLRSSGGEAPPASEDLHAQISEGRCPASGGESARKTKTAPDESPIVSTFPCRGPVKEWRLRQREVDELSGFYPGVDVPGVCRDLLVWAVKNPDKRKTAKRMSAWLAGRIADRANEPRRPHSSPTVAANGHARPARPTTLERIEALGLTFPDDATEGGAS